MAARAQWGTDREWGVHWDIMVLREAGWGGQGLKSVAVRVSLVWHRNPTLTSSPIKCLCLLGHPPMGMVRRPVQTHTSPLCGGHTQVALPYPVNPGFHISFEPITVKQVFGTLISTFAHTQLWKYKLESTRLQISVDNANTPPVCAVKHRRIRLLLLHHRAVYSMY